MRRRPVLAALLLAVGLAASGTFRRAVAVLPGRDSVRRIAVARDGQSLWLASATGFVVRVSMRDGSEIERRPVAPQIFTGLVAGAGHFDVPASSFTALIALAAALALAAIWTMRRW